MPLLSHYTTREGLDGIAETRVFWATSFMDLNDKSEYFYAWRSLLLGAKEQFLLRIPEKARPKSDDYDSVMGKVSDDLRVQMAQTDGVGHMYVTSFARGTTEDHKRRGILTIWDRYTAHKGYCLQFEQADVERMVRLDAMKTNYVSLALTEVKYGIDTSAFDYKELCFQLAQFFLSQVARQRFDLGVTPDYEKIWAVSHLLRKLMDYCGKHKDPCYEDEREVRIFAYPAENAEGRVFTGIADIKARHTSPSGKKYIKLGEHWRPGIVPRRIIVGTKANSDIASILAKYVPSPEVLFADLPVI